MAHMKRGAVGSGRGGLPRCAQVWPPCMPAEGARVFAAEVSGADAAK